MDGAQKQKLMDLGYSETEVRSIERMAKAPVSLHVLAGKTSEGMNKPGRDLIGRLSESTAPAN